MLKKVTSTVVILAASIFFQSAAADQLSTCATHTRLYASEKADSDASPAIRFGQKLAMAGGAAIGTDVGATAGAKIASTKVTPDAGLNADLKYLQQYYRNYQQYIDDAHKMNAFLKEKILKTPTLLPVAQEVREIIRTRSPRPKYIEEIYKDLQPHNLTDSERAVIRQFFDLEMESTEHHAKAQKHGNLEPYKRLRKENIISDWEMAGRTSELIFDGPGTVQDAYKDLKEKSNQAIREKQEAHMKAAKSQLAAKGAKVGGAAGFLIGAMAGNVAFTEFVRRQCSSDLSLGQAKALAPLVNVSLAESCELSSAGAKALTTTKVEELEKLCAQIPNLDEIVYQMLQKHRAAMAKLPIPEVSGLQCNSTGGMKTMALKLGDSGRSYEVSQSTSSSLKNELEILATDNNYNFSNESKQFRIQVGVDPAANTLEEVTKSSDLYASEGVDSLKAKSFAKFYLERSQNQAPSEPKHRKRFMVGEAADALAATLAVAQNSCRKPGSAGTGNGTAADAASADAAK